jgi:hypothetical protein
MKAFKDLQRIYSRLFFVSEHIPATEAWAYRGNPR